MGRGCLIRISCWKIRSCANPISEIAHLSQKSEDARIRGLKSYKLLENTKLCESTIRKRTTCSKIKSYSNQPAIQSLP